jgi:hypothetical protein
LPEMRDNREGVLTATPLTISHSVGRMKFSFP